MSNAGVFSSLAQNMTSAQEERAKRVAGIKKETGDLLKGFDRAHSEMNARLRAELAEGETERMKTSQAEANQRMERIAETKKETDDLLKGFGKERSEMNARLKSELAKVTPELVAGEEARRSEVKNLLESLRKDSAETAGAWRELVTTMQAKRGVAVAPPPVKPPEAAVENPPVAEVEEEVPVEEAVSEEKEGLENWILELIQKHPEGVKLTGIAEATGEARIKVGNITRLLVDEGKIRKEGLLYFPI